MALVDVRGFNFGPGVLAEAQRFTQLRGQKQQVQARELALGEQRGQLDRAAQIRQLLGQIGQEAPQTQQQQQLAAQTADLGGPQALAEQPGALLSEEELIAQARRISPGLANQQIKELGLDDPTRRAEASRFAAQLQSTPFEQRASMINTRAQSLQAQGRDPKDTLQLLQMSEPQQNEAITGIQLLDLSTKERFAVTERRRAAEERAERGAEVPAEQRAFESLIEDFSPEDQEAARQIKAGLKGRKIGSALQTITEEGTAEKVGTASATIKQREKFGEMTGSSRAKSIDKGFERIQKIDQGITTIDRAISVLKGGAKTGAIQRFLPSIKAASVELDQIRNQFALDVIGSVTLGAISESELELAKQTGLPTGLDEPALITHLEDRRAAQQKLRNLYQEQISFLDQGGTIAGFLREKKRELGETARPTAQPEAAPEDAQTVIRFNRQGQRI
ncbi:MAG: hypothetical protein V3T88_02810 [Nitrosomonadaceae bacterium]